MRRKVACVTNRARLALADCDHALELLRGSNDPFTFRVLWVAGIALARAVGHILDRVDAAQDPATRHAVDAAWSSWKADKQGNAIFWQFIDDERNQVLKQYEVGFFEGQANFVTGEEVVPIGWRQFPVLTDGAFAGRDCRDVLEQAIDWWERQLTAIDGVVMSRPGHA
jgi:hypothetical protein